MKKLYSLIDKIYREENLRKAFKKVKKKNGAPGIDGETVTDFHLNATSNINLLQKQLVTNTYKSSPVKRVEIDKLDGGTRLLGIPTVKDRVVQQAVVNIIGPHFEKTFHPSSYGYRPNRSQQQAVAKAERFMNRYNLNHVVDMDLSKCFDTLNHDLIIKSVAELISDSRVLNLIREFLESGVVLGGEFTETEIGSAQGGVISPLLSNIYLNYFDQKMKTKSIRIVRFADDILIFAKDKQTAGNYKVVATKILEKELLLKVNEEKTKITSLHEGVEFLGFVIYEEWVAVQDKRFKRFKEKIRLITRRNAGRSLETVIKELNPVLRGWINYYKAANIKSKLVGLMSWIRRRLRMIKMKQWKTYKKMHKEMRKKGIKGNDLKMAVTKWKNSKVHIIHRLLPNQYFKDLKLIDLCEYKVGVLSNYREFG
jgi:RNA-directed DNA polymerase